MVPCAGTYFLPDSEDVCEEVFVDTITLDVDEESDGGMGDLSPLWEAFKGIKVAAWTGGFEWWTDGVDVMIGTLEMDNSDDFELFKMMLLDDIWAMGTEVAVDPLGRFKVTVSGEAFTNTVLDSNWLEDCGCAPLLKVTKTWEGLCFDEGWLWVMGTGVPELLLATYNLCPVATWAPFTTLCNTKGVPEEGSWMYDFFCT